MFLTVVSLVVAGCAETGGTGQGELEATERADEDGSADGGEPSPSSPTTGGSATALSGAEATSAPLVVAPSGDDAGNPSTTSADTTSATDTGDPSPSSVTPSSVGSDQATTPPASQTPTSPSVATTAGGPQPEWGSPETVRLRFESRVADVAVADFEAEAMAILADPRGWGRAGFTFVVDQNAPYTVILAEGPEVDQLCLPLRTFGTVSCQNGPVVALNADRWRGGVDHWVLGTEVYRGYLVNHEVGHLLGQRHPKPRCPVAGRPAGVMEQQTAGLEGCVGNPWPRDWEIDYGGQRPVVYAPLPDWGPDPVPTNSEGQ